MNTMNCRWIAMALLVAVLTACSSGEDAGTDTAAAVSASARDPSGRGGAADQMDHRDHMAQAAGAGGDREGGPAEIEAPRLTAGGLFRVSARSELDPIGINRMHSWTLHVETADGNPVDDAGIEISGGMPAHNHGLPTAPAVTKTLGGGDYLVEGMQFQMPGHWQVTFEISAAGGTDSAIFDFVLP